MVQSQAKAWRGLVAVGLMSALWAHSTPLWAQARPVAFNVRSVQNGRWSDPKTWSPSEGIGQLTETLNALQDDLGDIVTQANLLRVTASIGTQMAEFVHEIQILLGTAQTVNDALGRLSEDMDVPKIKRAAIQKLHVIMSDMKRQLDRQASYLLDIATPDASRRRSKQKLAERFNSAVKLVARAAEKREIDIFNEIPDDLKCPAMFPAEITTVFSNLLTNAVKNAGDGGSIIAQGKRTEDGITVTIQNAYRFIRQAMKRVKSENPRETGLADKTC